MRHKSGLNHRCTAFLAIVVVVSLWTAPVGAVNPLTSAVFVPHSLTVHLKNHAATLLADGTVLVTGGGDNGGTVQSSAEIYDPATGMTTTLLATLTVARKGHTATLLDDDRVLIAGGTGASNTVLTSAELYTPSAR